MHRKTNGPIKTSLPADRYRSILAELVELLEHARRAAARAVNAVMTATYWQVGRRIVESEQRGARRAGYGEELLSRLSADLTARFGRGFSRQNLQSMRAFYLFYPQGHIRQTTSGKSAKGRNRQITSGTLTGDMRNLSAPFPLPWSHYVRLLSVENPTAREFYATEALRGGWTVKQLGRQIGSLFYERTALSRNKAAMLTKHNRPKSQDRLNAGEEIKDPFMLEFLGLKDEYSESEIEEALIRHLESFLLELGGDFTFVGRQRRLRVGGAWYRIDLLFYHRRLRCLVIIDLKTDEFTHADAGQMHLYCNYAREHWMLPDENPPVGLILCAEKDSAVAHYSLDGLPNKILAARYKTALPRENVLVAELDRTRKLLESRLTNP
jgi:predicted nuclease of restriction endonuclease-like (RecB) superfamily